MLVNELIERLNELKEEIGNVEVELYMEDIDGTQCGFDDINEVELISKDFDKIIYIAHRNKFDVEE